LTYEETELAANLPLGFSTLGKLARRLKLSSAAINRLLGAILQLSAAKRLLAQQAIESGFVDLLASKA
jgi:hypothetical protein